MKRQCSEMSPILRITLVAAVISLTAMAGCTTPEARLKYQSGTPSDGAGFPFVIPRTTLKVDVAHDKDTNTDKLTFTVVPTSESVTPNQALKIFVATDDSRSNWLTPTTVTSVTYAAPLVVNSLGTQVTDNRADAISAAVKGLALVGALAAAAPEDNCKMDTPGLKDEKGKPIPLASYPLKSFEIDAVKHRQGQVPNSRCWGYAVTEAPYQPQGRKVNDVNTLAATEGVSWFPIPSCKTYVVEIYRCATDSDCVERRKDLPAHQARIALSDGTTYQKIPLPTKGKISLHPDYCEADVTNDSVGSSNPALLKELFSDYATATAKK